MSEGGREGGRVEGWIEGGRERGMEGIGGRQGKCTDKLRLENENCAKSGELVSVPQHGKRTRVRTTMQTKMTSAFNLPSTSFMRMTFRLPAGL